MATQLEAKKSLKNGSSMLGGAPIYKISISHWILFAFETIVLLGWIFGLVRYSAHVHHQSWWTIGMSLSAITFFLYARGSDWKKMLSQDREMLHPAVWLYFLALFLPSHLFFTGSGSKPHIVPLLIAFLWVCTEQMSPKAILRLKIPAILNSIEKHAVLALFMFGAVYFAATTYLALVKFTNFGYVGQDIAYFMQCLYTGLHGQLFSSNQYQDLLYTTTVHSDFAGHNQPILFFLLPFYWLSPSIEMLFILRNLFMALCIVPAYIIARQWLRPAAAVISVVGLMLGPVILYQNIYDYAPLSMVGLPLLFALQFYFQRRYTPFFLMLVCCLLIREDLVFVLAGIGFVAWWQHRQWRWSLVPLMLACLWSILTWKIILPHFQAGAVSAVQGCFSYLGNSTEEMLLNIVQHPGIFLTHKIAVYLSQIITPLGGLTIFTSPISLISSPYILINILGDKGCNAAIAFRHYSLIPVLLLFPASVGLLHWIRKSNVQIQIKEISLSLLLFYAGIASTILATGRNEIFWLRQQPWQQEAKSVALMLPANAAVAVPRYMLPLVANRENVYQSLRLLEYHHPDARYIVLDRDNQRAGLSSHWINEYEKLLGQLSNNSQFSLIYSSENYLVYKRIGPPLRSFRSPTIACIDGGCS